MYSHFNILKFKCSKRLIVIWYDIDVDVPVGVPADVPVVG